MAHVGELIVDRYVSHAERLMTCELQTFARRIDAFILICPPYHGGSL